MTNAPSNDETQNEPRPHSLRDFEDCLRQISLGNERSFSTVDGRSRGPELERRDRLMYDSGYAAALAELQANALHKLPDTRTSKSAWQTIAIAASILAVALGSLHVLNFAQPRPQVAKSTESERIASETISSDSIHTTAAEGLVDSAAASQSKLHPIIWPGMAQAPHREKTITDTASVTSSWSGWTELEPRREKLIPHNNQPRTNAIDAPLRVFEYHRLLDRI